MTIFEQIKVLCVKTENQLGRIGKTFGNDTTEF